MGQMPQSLKFKNKFHNTYDNYSKALTNIPIYNSYNDPDAWPKHNNCKHHWKALSMRILTMPTSEA